MKKKILFVVITVLGVMALAGCSTLQNVQLPWAKSSTTSNSSSTNPQNAAQNFANQPLESKLAIGLLELEGTQNAVTAQQAAQLLPLWKAVKGLETNANTTTEEMNGLYQQIEQVLTPQQTQAIKDMKMDQTTFQGLMKKYNVQFAPRFNGTPGANGFQRGTQTANGGTNGGTTGGANGGFNPGGFNGAGGPQGGFQGVPGAGGNFRRNGTGTGNGTGQFVRRTPQPGQTGQRGFRGGLNFLFVNPLITLLEQRASA